MNTRSAKNKTTGLFSVTVWDWNGVEFFKGEFVDVGEADKAANDAERRMALKMQAPVAALTLDEILMSDDELLAELQS